MYPVDDASVHIALLLSLNFMHLRPRPSPPAEHPSSFPARIVAHLNRAQRILHARKLLAQSTARGLEISERRGLMRFCCVV